MLIKQSRVRVIPPAILSFGIEEPIVLAVTDSAAIRERMLAAGLTVPPCINSAILPGVVGPTSEFNAEGKYIVHKDRKKETAYRQMLWTWKTWSGRGTDTRSRIVEVPYKRYPRTFVPPPGIELSVLATLDGNTVITTQPFKISDLTNDEVCHRINLMLELFGECEVLREDLSRFVRAQVSRVNWKILPQGKRAWEDLEKDLKEIIEAQPEGNQAPLKFRLKTINDKGPDMVVTGEGGFKDYVVFGFTSKNLFILESPLMDNATYVFGSDWKQLAQLTKTELLAGGLVQHRLIHRNNWKVNVNKLFE